MYAACAWCYALCMLDVLTRHAHVVCSMSSRRRSAGAIEDGSPDGENPRDRARRIAREKARARAAAAAERIRGKSPKPSSRTSRRKSTSGSSSKKSTPKAKTTPGRSSSRPRRKARANWVDSDSDEEKNFEQMEMEEEVEHTSSSGGHTRGSKSTKVFAAEKRGQSEPRVTRMEHTQMDWGSDSDGEDRSGGSGSGSRRRVSGRRRAAIKDTPRSRRTSKRSSTPTPAIEDGEASDGSDSGSESDIIDDMDRRAGPDVSDSDDSDDDGGNARPTTPMPANSGDDDARAKAAAKKEEDASLVSDLFKLVFYSLYIALSVLAFSVTAFAIAAYTMTYFTGVYATLESWLSVFKASAAGPVVRVVLWLWHEWGLLLLGVFVCACSDVFAAGGSCDGVLWCQPCGCHCARRPWLCRCGGWLDIGC